MSNATASKQKDTKTPEITAAQRTAIEDAFKAYVVANKPYAEAEAAHDKKVSRAARLFESLRVKVGLEKSLFSTNDYVAAEKSGKTLPTPTPEQEAALKSRPASEKAKQTLSEAVGDAIDKDLLKKFIEEVHAMHRSGIRPTLHNVSEVQNGGFVSLGKMIGVEEPKEAIFATAAQPTAARARQAASAPVVAASAAEQKIVAKEKPAADAKIAAEAKPVPAVVAEASPALEKKPAPALKQAPQATSVPVATSTAKPGDIVVKAGDTLTKIAQKHASLQEAREQTAAALCGKPKDETIAFELVKALQAANNPPIKNADLIQTGWTLQVPTEMQIKAAIGTPKCKLAVTDAPAGEPVAPQRVRMVFPAGPVRAAPEK